MATNPPSERCFICGGELQWEVVDTTRAPWELPRFGPTEYRQLPHTCPPAAVEKWIEEAFARGEAERRKPFFTRV